MTLSVVWRQINSQQARNAALAKPIEKYYFMTNFIIRFSCKIQYLILLTIYISTNLKTTRIISIVYHILVKTPVTERVQYL